MTLDDAIAQFASLSHDLPRDAMGWCVDHWDEAAPPLLEMLDRYADGSERPDEAASVLFIALHLMAEQADRRAFAPLCRLARDHDAIDTVLMGGITTTLKQVMISSYDGDFGAFTALIESRDVDEFVRGAAFEALAYLGATGRIDRVAAVSWLAGLRETLTAEEPGSWVWIGWANAIALLGLEELKPLVKTAFDQELIDPSWSDFAGFEQDLQRTLDDPERMAGFARDDIRPLGNAVEELSKWYSFSEQRKEDERKAEMRRREREAQGRSPTDDWAPAGLSAPHVNPFKSVGRNDPCPCGSGKKFKKCCLR
jgi:hypothetical protein